MKKDIIEKYNNQLKALIENLGYGISRMSGESDNDDSVKMGLHFYGTASVIQRWVKYKVDIFPDSPVCSEIEEALNHMHHFLHDAHISNFSGFITKARQFKEIIDGIYENLTRQTEPSFMYVSEDDV